MITPVADYKRKFLVVLDGSREAIRAAIFAGSRVKRLGGTLVLLRVIETADFEQFLGVQDVMRAEAREAAEADLDAARQRLADLGELRIESLIRDGDLREVVETLIAQDPAIGILVLGSAGGREGPGTLVTDMIAELGSGALPVIVTIVPGQMTEDQVLALT